MRQAAEYARVTEGTIRRWIHRGRIVGYHAGRHLRVKRSELDQVLRFGFQNPDRMTPEQRAEYDFAHGRFSTAPRPTRPRGRRGR